MLTPLQIAGAAATGLVGGILSGFFGVGGNFLLVPLLALVLGLPQQQAQGLTLAALLPPLRWPAVWEYQRAGVPLSWPLVGMCILGFLPLVPLGSYLATVLPGPALSLGFGLMLLVVAVRTWRVEKSRGDRPHLAALPSNYVPIALGSGAAAGFASGLLGIGGAIVLIPLLTRLLKLSQRQAQLTSLAMLLPPIALPGVWVYAQAEGGVPLASVVPVALGFTVGTYFGARLSHLVSAARLARGFALVMAVSALVMIASALDGMSLLTAPR